MTPQQKIKALAGLDGWAVTQLYDGLWLLFNNQKQVNSYNWETEAAAWSQFTIAHGGNDYLTSRDAIVSLVLTWCSDSVGHKILFVRQMKRLIPGDLKDCDQGIFIIFTATPSQLADALLIAAGLMED